jgi:hypothetical protein
LNQSPNFPLVFVLCNVKLHTCTILSITDFLDFDHCFSCEKQAIFWKLGLFPSSGEKGAKVAAEFSLTEGAVLSYWTTWSMYQPLNTLLKLS